ncbi:uncharacterized protein DSM5745_09248 [Aspergillus mulundensis]|uniref:AAA+ ATPase domain-containing protein n=1 Tax=Aspergillus mulundensis TaxID=1810919 RepID=A0A3D8QZZ8_9EURO|nr:Uncharacterized protein DSM5745_09248 [Aspergillus mulundensis]RDW67382.1 Uncharacterized protein DSM5745_09248 [Aspergillus mulundensis]
MAGPVQPTKRDSNGSQDKNSALAQRWSVEVWSERITSQQSVQISRDKLQKRVDAFLAHASVQENDELERSRQRLMDMIKEAQTASKEANPEAKEGSFRAKLQQGLTSTSEAVYRYSQILDPMMAQAPGYVSLAYGGIKIILTAQINYQELKEKVTVYLEQIATRFELIDHLTAYIPTKNLVARVGQAYSLFTKFLSKAVKHYTRSRMKTYLKALSSPWERFQELVDAIGQTFVDIKDIAQFHGLLAGQVNLEVSQRTLALMERQGEKSDTNTALLEDVLSQLHAISIQFTKEEDIRETASLVRQHVDQVQDDPTLSRSKVEPTEDKTDEHQSTMLDQLGGIFADLKNYNEETQRRKIAIEEAPGMQNHRSTQRNLLRSEKVLSWIESDVSQLLWVEGNNVLRRSDFNACFAIPLLVMGEGSFESTLVLRHFCGDSGMARRPSTLVQALLYQVIERNPSILQKRKHAFTSESAPTTQNLWKLLVECLEIVSAQCTFIIIDSFDHLDAEDAHEEGAMLAQLNDLVKDKTKLVKVLLTASLAQPLSTLPEEYQALTIQRFPRPGLRRSLSTAILEDQAQLISHQIIEIQERRCKLVSFHEIPFLYPSGTVIYQKNGDHWQAFVVAELSGMDPQPFGDFAPLQIRAWSVDHNGKYFTKKYHSLTIGRFSGKQEITRLKFIPAGYMPDETAVRKTLVTRGRRYWELGSTVSYNQFDGKHGPVRIVIDQQLRPLEETPTAQELADQFRPSGAHDLKPGVLITCPPGVAVFLLPELRWSTMDVDKIKELAVDEYRDLRSLIVDPGYKEILRSFVAGQGVSEGYPKGDDLRGPATAGTTVLLHGAPGTGKTFSVECLAESVQRPLLRLTHATLGGSVREVAKSLEESFHLSDRWGCIMLLDDVDTFLSTRTQDMSQNIMATLFMQLTEKHNGLLFLTTNRVGVLDEAFQSRIHMKLYYPRFTLEQVEAVLERSLRGIQDRFHSTGTKFRAEYIEIMEFIKRARENKAMQSFNGRDIINTCETALLLAKHEIRGDNGRGSIDPDAVLRLKASHFETAIKIATGFNHYMKEVRTRSDFDASAGYAGANTFLPERYSGGPGLQSSQDQNQYAQYNMPHEIPPHLVSPYRQRPMQRMQHERDNDYGEGE